MRREEVAMLSGTSAEYYLRLEQGRDRNPSVHVLESIGRVLQLEDDAYLISLAVERPRRNRGRTRRETVPASTARLVAELPFPAFVEGRYWTCSWPARSPPRSRPGCGQDGTGFVLPCPGIHPVRNKPDNNYRRMDDHAETRRDCGESAGHDRRDVRRNGRVGDPVHGELHREDGAGAVSRQMPWEASGLPVRPAGGAEPEGGYQPD
ncbi:helix-turn-helix domain-containing protein [Nonomuraea thailandensis]